MHMQHVICPVCGQLFRTRAHSVGCSHSSLDEDLVNFAHSVHRDHLTGQLELLIQEHDDTYGKRSE